MGFWERFAEGFMVRFEISFWLSHFSFVAATIVVGYQLKNRKTSLLGALGLTAGLTVFLVVLSNLFIVLVSQYFPLALNACWALCAAAIICLCNNYKRRTKLVFWMVLLGASFATSQIIGEASYLAGYFGASDPVFWTVRSFGSLFLILCAFFIKRFSVDTFDRISDSMIILLGVVNVFLLTMRVLVTVFFDMSRVVSPRDIPHITVTLLACFSGLIMLDLVFYYMLYRNTQAQESLLFAQAKVLDDDKVRDLMLLTENNMTQIREFRHDVTNQLSYMKLLAEAGKQTELKEYLQQFASNIAGPLTAFDCGNQNIDTIMNLEGAKAQRRGIEIDAKIIVSPKLPVKDIDMCSLLTNVIDNALDGAQEAGGARVKVSILLREEELFIRVRNPTSKTRASLRQLSTTKADKLSHGYGTKIVKKLVDKYHGYLHYEILDGDFLFECVLTLAPEAVRPIVLPEEPLNGCC